MTVKGKAGAGRRSSRRAPIRATKGWARILLSVVVAFGLGWLVPVGGLAAASATPAHHGGHGRRGSDPGHNSHGLHSATGTVTLTGPGSDEFTMVTESGTTLDVSTAGARYIEQGVPKGTAVSIVVGDKVRVKGKDSSGTFDAKLVDLPEALAVGTVQSFTTSPTQVTQVTEITLDPVRSTLTSTSVTIEANISSATRYRDPGVTGPNISVGERVRVRGTQEGLVMADTLGVDATLVVVPLMSYVGVVGNLDTTAGTFTLTSTSSTLTVDVVVGSATKYEVPGSGRPKTGSLDSLVNGDIARVTGNQDGSGTVSATLVRVLGKSRFRSGDHGRSGPGGNGTVPGSTTSTTGRSTGGSSAGSGSGTDGQGGGHAGGDGHTGHGHHSGHHGGH